MVRVGIYARLSRDRSGESTSIERQIEACRKRLEPDWTEAEVYRDNDISAYSGKARPGFEQMINDAQEGRIDIVIAYALDRLGRRPKDIERLMESRVRFITVRDGLDSKSATSELFIRILAAMAKMESDNTAARIRLKHDELRTKGMWQGGPKPYGWKPGEAEALRRAARRLIGGESIIRVARDMNIDMTRLRRTLISPRMVGRRAIGGAVGMPVILDEDTWQRVRVLLTDPKRRTNWPPDRPGRQLRGLVFCGRCGSKMLGHSKKGQPRYVCRKQTGCGKVSINADPLDRHVLREAHDEIWRRYHDVDLRALAKSAREEMSRDTDAKVVELAEYRSRLNPLVDMYVSGALSLDEWNRARGPLVERIEELERSLQQPRPEPLARLEHSLADVGDPREWIGDIIEKVTVAPAVVRGRRFDPSRVSITFTR